MRFKLDPVPQPEKFARRTEKRFALFPKTLKDEYFVWLETYYSEETYYRFDNRQGRWVETNNWSNSTEQRKILNFVKISDQQDTIDE